MADEEKLSAGRSLLRCCGGHWRGKMCVFMPLITLPILVHGYTADSPEFRCMYLVLNMALFWITEALPLYVTSLFPIVFLPLFGILSTEKTCKMYFTDTLVMFLGGLILALAIEYSRLDQRIALNTIKIVGCTPRRLHLGIVMVTCFISLWISNSAATAMLCPIVKAVLNEMESQKIFEVYKTQEEEPMEPGEPPHPSNLSMAFYLGVAYGATIGGCGTLIGTGTNLTFVGLYETRFPDSEEKVDFPLFMAYAIPICVIVNVILLYFSLQFTHMGLFRPKSKDGQEVRRGFENKDVAKAVIKERAAALGRMSCHEIQVSLLFTIMVILLFTRKPGFMPGWGDFLNATVIKTSAPTMLPVLFCFMLPTQYTFFKYCCGRAPFPGRTLDGVLSWVYISKNTPWGLAYLLGGGFALAEGSKISGMAKMLGNSLGFLEVCPKTAIIAITLIICLFCTAFSSNVAICNILIPIFSELAITLKIHPLLLTLPQALAISMAYHLPVSTPPNAIISSYGNIKTKYIAKAGCLPTLWAFLVLFINANSWGYVIFPATTSFPDWAKGNGTR